MSRHDADRLADMTSAIEAIQSHLAKGDLHDGLVYDAVRVRLIEIGEAVKSISVSRRGGYPMRWSIKRSSKDLGDRRPRLEVGVATGQGTASDRQTSMTIVSMSRSTTSLRTA